MVRTRLTGVGKLFAGVMALFYIASVTSQSGLLLLFIGLIGGCITVNWLAARRTVEAVGVHAPSELFINEGARADHAWRFSNKTKRKIELLEVESGAGRLFRIPVLSERETASLVPDLVYQRRGVYPNGEVKLTCAAPFGLVRSERKLALPGGVVVYPKIYDTAAPLVSGLDTMAGGKMAGNRRLTSGTNFAGVRKWQPGDPIKQIHWKSTANRGEMMVKTFDEELSGRVAVILDCTGAGKDRTDDSVRAAGSIMFAALDAGHQVDFWDSRTREFKVFSPFSAGVELLDLLARYQSEPVDWELVTEEFPRKAAAALVLVQWHLEHGAFAAELEGKGRKISVYLAETGRAPRGVEHWFRFDGHKIWSDAPEMAHSI